MMLCYTGICSICYTYVKFCWINLPIDQHVFPELPSGSKLAGSDVHMFFKRSKFHLLHEFIIVTVSNYYLVSLLITLFALEINPFYYYITSAPTLYNTVPT